MNEAGQIIAEFLEETAPLVERASSLPFETAVELYDMYETAARTATDNIAHIWSTAINIMTGTATRGN